MNNHPSNSGYHLVSLSGLVYIKGTLYQDGTAARVSYAWEFNDCETFVNEAGRGSSVIPETLFDAETGRCLIKGKYLEKVQVVDFLPWSFSFD